MKVYIDTRQINGKTWPVAVAEQGERTVCVPFNVPYGEERAKQMAAAALRLGGR